MLLHYSRFIEHFRFMDIECHIHANKERARAAPFLLHCCCTIDAAERLRELHQAHSSNLFSLFLFDTVIFLSLSKRSEFMLKRVVSLVRKVQKWRPSKLNEIEQSLLILLISLCLSLQASTLKFTHDTC